MSHANEATFLGRTPKNSVPLHSPSFVKLRLGTPVSRSSRFAFAGPASDHRKNRLRGSKQTFEGQQAEEKFTPKKHPQFRCKIVLASSRALIPHHQYSKFLLK
jgi:hypothetical protein